MVRGLLLALFIPALASASPKPTVVVMAKPDQLAAQTATVLYFNRCRGGCVIKQGTVDDVRTRTSSIPRNCPQGQCTLTEFMHNDATWDAMMQCLREVYSPYGVMITDQVPAAGIAYNENIVAGLDTEIGRSGAGGIAPGTCEPYSYAISYTFANGYPPDPYTLCYVAAQETGHAYGMADHAFSFISNDAVGSPSDPHSACSDPMSYRVDCMSNGQRFFRNQAADCGDFTKQTSCNCGGMNPHLKLINALGPGQSIIPPPTVTLMSPQANATVMAGTNVVAEAYGKRGVAKVELWINGYKWGEKKGVAFNANEQPKAPYAIPIPNELPNSLLDVEIVAKDDIGVETRTAPIPMTKGAACGSAADCETTGLKGMKCEAGKCFWEPPSGELGDACTYPQFCLTGMCIGLAGEDEMKCSKSCVPNVGDSCPEGFECLAANATSGACWPKETGGSCLGCASTGTGAAAQASLVFLGLLLVLRRRRRR